MLGIDVLRRMGSQSTGAVDIRTANIHGLTYAEYTVALDGFTYKRTTSGAAVQSLSWLSPQSGMDQFDVRARLQSGDIPPGAALSTWLNLGTSQTWGWAAETVFHECELLIEIRRSSTGAVLDSATVTIGVEGTS